MDHKTKPIYKQHNSQGGNDRKPYRPTFNNNNPHNKLSLNEFHQIVDPHATQQKRSEASKLHKKKRDLQRMLKHRQSKGVQINQEKKQELQNVQKQVNSRRKKFEKDKRKEFFLDQKYKDIKRIELRKVYKHLGETKANTSMTDQQKRTEIDEWEKKLRYIKHFPKTLKYISLFPSAKPLQEKTLQFQKKIMGQIEQENKKKVAHLNFYKSENDPRGKSNKKTQQQNQNEDESKGVKKKSILPLTKKLIETKNGKKSKKVVDDFFLQEDNSEAIDQQKNDDSEDQQQSEVESGDANNVQDEDESDQSEQDSEQ